MNTKTDTLTEPQNDRIAIDKSKGKPEIELSAGHTENIEIIGIAQEINTVDKATLFTTHNMTFKLPIITGTQPKSKHPFKMNNWTGYRFTEDRRTIVTTPKSAIISICESITSVSLKSTYAIGAEIAEIYACEFAKKHDIVLGEPQLRGTPHCTIHE